VKGEPLSAWGRGDGGGGGHGNGVSSRRT
jgi:hypothetical protein